MKIKISQEKFSYLVSKAQSVMERKSTRPILENILLSAKDGKLKVSATDLRVSLEEETDCVVERFGAISVNGRKLFEIVKELPREEISVEVKDNGWVSIYGQKMSFNLPGIMADEFPTIPPVPENLQMMKAKVFEEMVGKTIFAASNDESRIYLCGIFFKEEIGEDGKTVLKMVATDGHRLSLMERKLDSTISLFKDGVIVPKKGVSELKSLLGGMDGDFGIACSEGKLFARIKDTNLSVTLIDATFPNYNQVLPKITGQGVLIPCDQFKNALRRVSILSDQDTHSVIMEIEKNQMVLTSDNPSVGDAKEYIDVDYDGMRLKVAFNANYIMEVIKATTDDTIRLEVKDSLSPAVFIGTDADAEFISVIMPMRID